MDATLSQLRSRLAAGIPLLVRRGGRDIKKNAAKPPLMERTGWSLTENLSECESETLPVSDHPVCAASVASLHFLTGAATPPHEEGNTPSACRRSPKLRLASMPHIPPLCHVPSCNRVYWHSC